MLPSAVVLVAVPPPSVIAPRVVPALFFADAVKVAVPAIFCSAAVKVIVALDDVVEDSVSNRNDDRVDVR